MRFDANQRNPRLLHPNFSLGALRTSVTGWRTAELVAYPRSVFLVLRLAASQESELLRDCGTLLTLVPNEPPHTNEGRCSTSPTTLTRSHIRRSREAMPKSTSQCVVPLYSCSWQQSPPSCSCTCCIPFYTVHQNLTARPTRVLVTFSTPFIQAFYFLRSSAEGGIRYGVLGFCRELTETCTRQCVHSSSRKVRVC